MRRATTDADVLVIGSGVAGLAAALAATEHARVTVLTAARLGEGNSMWAQGGVAAAIGADDSPRLHARDTIAVGGGLNDGPAVEVLTGEGPSRVAGLLALGAPFDRDPQGAPQLAREAAHSVRRILHSADTTGATMTDTLRRAVLASPAIRVIEGATVVALQQEGGTSGGQVTGAVVDHEDGTRLLHRARAVVLATGGSGRLYAVTTNPPGATAAGVALAARAGATLRDLEFVQFHPTALAAPGADPLPLVTEALRGEGAIVVDGAGRRFLYDAHPDGELAPRDVVARAIAAEVLAGRPVFLDATGAVGQRFPTRFPTVFGTCTAHGIDPRVQPIPVTPAAHYHMGGVATGLSGETDVPGLFAAGEVACTGVHGANRLASNSLLEALVFGARAGAAATGAEPVRRSTSDRPGTIPARNEPDRAASARVEAEVRRLMWHHVGVVRAAEGLTLASQRLAALAELAATGATLDARSSGMLLAARLIATAASARTESRGAHCRTDRPVADPSWGRHLDLRLQAGEVVVTSTPHLELAEALS